MKMCPKEIKQMIDLSWDTIQEKYSVMREKVVTWATNAAEKAGGPVAMDVGEVEQEGWDEYPWWGEEEISDVGAVSPNTKC